MLDEDIAPHLFLIVEHLPVSAHFFSGEFDGFLGGWGGGFCVNWVKETPISCTDVWYMQGK